MFLTQEVVQLYFLSRRIYLGGAVRARFHEFDKELKKVLYITM